MRTCVQELLKQYLDVEQNFQCGHYDKCVSTLREKHKDEGMAVVVQKIFSHLQVPKKNSLVIKVRILSLNPHIRKHSPFDTDSCMSRYICS